MILGIMQHESLFSYFGYVKRYPECECVAFATQNLRMLATGLFLSVAIFV